MKEILFYIKNQNVFNFFLYHCNKIGGHGGKG